MHDLLDEHIAWLRAKIELDEEAQDPDGALAGLYEALKMAQETLRRGLSVPVTLKAVVWGGREPVAALSGEYEGKEGVKEGLTSALLTVLDLWNAGEADITVELYREEGERQ